MDLNLNLIVNHCLKWLLIVDLLLRIYFGIMKMFALYVRKNFSIVLLVRHLISVFLCLIEMWINF